MILLHIVQVPAYDPGAYYMVTNDILRYLAAADPLLGAVIERAGPCTLEPQTRRSPYEALVRAVAHQQLNGKAAQTILGRFVSLFPRRRFPSPDQVHAIDAGQLTAIGFSRAKASYVKEIARHTREGLVLAR